MITRQQLTRAARKLKNAALDGLSRRAKRFWRKHVREPPALKGGGAESASDYVMELGAPHGPMFEPQGYGALKTPRLEVQAADEGEDSQIHTEQISTSGVEYVDEMPKNRDENHEFRPVKVRGRSTGQGHGLFHQMFLSSSTYWRTWGTPLQAMITGNFEVQPPDLQNPTEEQKQAAERRAEKIERTLLDNLDGGWRQFLTEWWYAGIGGFSVFEQLHHGFDRPNKAGLVREFSFIYPSSVDGWLLDPDTDKLQAVRFEDTDGNEYTIPAEHLLLYSYLRFGSDFEGYSPMRPVTRWIQAVQIFSQLEALSAERMGVPIITGRYENADARGNRADESDILMQALESIQAQESPVIRLPDGAELELHSAAGDMPDFEEPKRFCLERITEVLSGEGSLIAVGDTGAFAARESANKDALQVAAFVAKMLCETVNGANNRPYTGPIKDMEELHWGGPLQPGRYCWLKWTPGETRDRDRVSKINESAKAGTIKPDKEVEREVRKDLDVPLGDRLKEDGSKDTQAQPVAASEQWDLDNLEASEVVKNGGLHLKAADIDPDKAEDLQDRLEARMARRWKKVAAEHKRQYRERVRSLVEQADSTAAAQKLASQAADEIEEEFRPKYIEAARDVLKDAKDRGAKDLIRSQGKTFPQTDSVPVGPETEARLESEAERVGKHAFNRQHGRFEERINRMVMGEDRKKLETLAASTYKSVAQTTVSSAYNLGRHNVVEETEKQYARIAAPGTDTRIPAERSAVMDRNTCDECAELNGRRAFVGSDTYWDLTPPARCEGGGYCRCIWVYILPSEKAFGQAVDALRRAA